MTQIYQVDSQADDQDPRGGLWSPVVSLWLPSQGNSSTALQQWAGNGKNWTNTSTNTFTNTNTNLSVLSLERRPYTDWKETNIEFHAYTSICRRLIFSQAKSGWKRKKRLRKKIAFSVRLCCTELREVLVEATEEKSSPAVRRPCQTKASLAERFISLSLISPFFLKYVHKKQQYSKYLYNIGVGQ